MSLTPIWTSLSASAASSPGTSLVGLVVTIVPKMPIWKAFIFNGLHFMQYENVLI